MFDEKWFVKLCETVKEMFRFEKVQYVHNDKTEEFE